MFLTPQTLWMAFPWARTFPRCCCRCASSECDLKGHEVARVGLSAMLLGARFQGRAGADNLLLPDANGNLDPEAGGDGGSPPPSNYGRRRSRAVLYQLSGHYKQTDKSKLKLNNVSTTSLIINHKIYSHKIPCFLIIFIKSYEIIK